MSHLEVDETIMRKQHGELPMTVEDGGAWTFDTRFRARIAVITEAGATATISRVDTETATVHTTGATNQWTVPESTQQVYDVDWPFYRVSVAGGNCRVALI